MCKGICLSGFPLTASQHISSSAFPTSLHWWQREIPTTATRFRSTNQAQEFALQYSSVPWNKNYVGVGCKHKRNLIFCPTTWSWWMKLVNQTLRKKGGDKSGDKKRLRSVVQSLLRITVIAPAFSPSFNLLAAVLLRTSAVKTCLVHTCIYMYTFIWPTCLRVKSCSHASIFEMPNMKCFETTWS